MRRLALAVAAAATLLVPLAGVTAAHAAAPSASLALEVTPASATVGDTIVVTVRASGVSDLYAYDLVLTVDDAHLTPTGQAPTGPDGGYTSGVADPGSVTITHTRLGTSPGLSSTGGIVLATLSLRASSVGAADIALSSARLVSSTGDVTEVGTSGSATVDVAALPTPEPSATPTPTASPTAAPSESATPPAAAASGTGNLATTGLDATVWMVSGALGLALIAAGALVVARRRQRVRE